MNEPSKLWALLSMVGQDAIGDMPQDTSTYLQIMLKHRPVLMTGEGCGTYLMIHIDASLPLK